MQTIVRTGVSLLYQAVPDEVQNEIIQIGENLSRDKWLIGDFANTIKGYVREQLLNCSIMDVYLFVSQLLRDEFSARTIEYYSGLSAFFEPGIRAEFQVLSHSHFAYARQYGDDWLKVLNLAMDIMDQSMSGKVPSVAQLDYVLMQRGGVLNSLPPEPDVPFEQIQGIEDEQTVETDYINSIISVPLKAAITALETLQKILQGFGRSEQANKLGEIVRELQQSIDSVL